MSMKRSDDDEQQKRNPDSSVFGTALQNDIQTEHAKLTSSTATTLLDLPLELHEHILLEAIVSEIRERKLFRCGWKDSADRVAERLRNVCPQWDSVLTTNSCRNRLHGIIDTFPSLEISLTVLGMHFFSTWCIGVEVLGDEYFFLSHPPEKHAVIKICDRDDPKKEKRVIQLPSVTVPWNLVACSVSSCLYLLHKASHSVEILRIFSREGQELQVLPFITCSAQLVSRMCVSADGSLIVYQGPAPSTITTYNVDGLVQHQIELTKPLSFVRDIISKSNGNVIIVSRNLTEINRAGDVLRDYNCKVDGGYRGQIYCAVDIYDNVMTVDVGNSVRLLDSDFNQAEVKISDRWAKIRCFKHLYQLRYNRQRNEFMILDCCDADADSKYLPDQRLKVFDVTETIVSEDDVQNEEDVLHLDAQNEGEQAQNDEEEDPQIQEDSDNEEHPQNEEN